MHKKIRLTYRVKPSRACQWNETELMILFEPLDPLKALELSGLNELIIAYMETCT